MLHRTRIAAAIAMLAVGAATAAPPKVVTAPNSDPQCFAPWAANTKLFQYPAKKGPYRIALANGYIANTWRIQMIKTAKAYAAQPEVAAKLKEFKVVSTGEDVAAQIAAINNFIDSGYDAIVVNAQNPAAFKPVIKKANDAGVVLVAFDNILDTEEAINVNVDQKGLGKYWAEWLVKNVPNGGKVLEVRGVSGTSVDRDRHEGIQEVFKASGKKWDTVEVIGKWDDPTAQKVTADAIAVHKKFDGITAQGGDTGVVQAMIDAKHPYVPFGGEIIGEHSDRLLSMARLITLTHHEKWDGTGYHRGLKGEEIPLVGRITSIADVFDALTSVRPYKKAWPVADAVTLIQREAGRSFDPEMVQKFVALLPQILAIREQYSDAPQVGHNRRDT